MGLEWVTDHENADIELFSHVGEAREELAQFLLAFTQLAAPRVINTEAGHDRIDDEQPVVVGLKTGCQRIEELQLLLEIGQPTTASKWHRPKEKAFDAWIVTYLAVLGSSVGNILLCLFWVHCEGQLGKVHTDLLVPTYCRIVRRFERYCQVLA